MWSVPIALLAVLSAAEPNILQFVDPPSGPGAMAPNLSLQGSALILSWVQPLKTGARVRVSKLDGDRWSAPETVVENDRVLANWADVPSVTALGDERWLAHWAETSGAQKYAYDVLLGLREGGKWRAIGSPHDDGTPTEHGFVSIVPEAKTFRLFWLDGRNMSDHHAGSMTLRTALLSGDAIAGSTIADERTCECCSTSAAVVPGGSIIAYRDRSAEEIRDIAVVRWDGRTLSKPATVHDDGWKMPGCPVNGPSIGAEGQNVAVAWFTGVGQGEIRVAFSKDGGRSFRDAIRVDAEAKKAPIGRVDVILDAGDAIVSWIASSGEASAEIVARRVGALGVLGAVVPIAATDPARSSGFPRAIRAGKEAFFAWTEVGSPSRVRVARTKLSSFPNEAAAQAASAEPKNVPKLYAAHDLEGHSVSLADLKGKVVLINLWATWCKPCREEMPVLAALHREYEKRGVVVLGISVDDAGAKEKVRQMIGDLAVRYATWLDPNDLASRYFGATGLPATFVLDKSGEITHRVLGALGSDVTALRKAIDAALSKK